MSATLRVVTLNVWGLPWPVGRQVDERLEAIGSALPPLRPDVVAFQEVWTTAGRASLVAAGRRAGLAHAWHNEAGLGGSGLLLLSRHPFARTRFERYELRGLPQRVRHADWFGGKGFSEISVETNGAEVVLVDTHLHARYAPHDRDEYHGHRMAQVVQLAARLRDVEAPLVALGDFNFGDDRPEYRALRGIAGLRDVAAALGRAEDTTHADRPYRQGGGRIDYVFCRDGTNAGLRPRSVQRVFHEPRPGDREPRAYSDHDGLLAELELTPARGWTLPPVDPAAATEARDVLLAGREQAESRRREQRTAGAAGLGAGALALAATRRKAVTRRAALRGLLGAGALLGLPAGLGFGGLAELHGPEELRGFDAALARLPSPVVDKDAVDSR